MAKAVVSGARQTVAAMRTVAGAITPAVGDAAARSALQPMAERVKANARVLRDPESVNQKGGHLDQGVVIARGRNARRTLRVWIITFKKRARKIAHLVEGGTAPHWQPNRFGGIMHPGARPKPFMRTAFETDKRSVVERLRQSLATTLKAAVAKARAVR